MNYMVPVLDIMEVLLQAWAGIEFYQIGFPLPSVKLIIQNLNPEGIEQSISICKQENMISLQHCSAQSKLSTTF